MSRPSVDALLRRLALVPAGTDRFDGGLPDEGRLHVFGGLVASQSLRAASLTVDGFLVHSLHGYFLRPGTLGKPIVYDVERLRDGGSFVTRLVKARQDDQVIFQSTLSFHRPERGLSHAAPMPEVVRPETLPDFDARLDALRDRLLRRSPSAGRTSIDPSTTAIPSRSTISTRSPTAARSASGSGRTGRFRTSRTSIRPSSPTRRTSVCSTTASSTTGARSSTPSSSWRASITRSGSTGRSARTNGSST